MYDRLPAPVSSDTVDVADVARVLRRHSRAVLAFVALGVAASVAVLAFAPRQFEGRATLLARVGSGSSTSVVGRITGIGDLLGGLGGLAGAGGIETELQMLRSRELAGEVVDSLQLQFRMKAPARIPPYAVIADSRLTAPFAPRRLEFRRAENGTYRATWEDSTWSVTPGQPVALDIGSFTLRTATLPPAFTVTVFDREDAITRFAKRLQVTKAGGDVARIVYRGDDSASAATAANALTEFYLRKHRTIDRGVNARRVEYVTAQLDSTALQLARAERELRESQEQSRVLDPEVVGEVELEAAAEHRQRLTQLQVEESTIRQLVAQAEAGQISSRDLAAFPGFLRGTTVGPLMSQLTELEATRIRLLERRTEKDPDVVAVDKTMRVVEANIVAMARSYHSSLSKQRAQEEARLDSLQRTLLALPAAAQRGGRLKRDVLRLTQIYKALQAQLVEARLGAISEGGQLRQVDVAVPQRRPAFPNPILTLGIGTAGGLLCGLVAALFLGWFGRWLRDPVEIERAVGVVAQRYEPNAPLLMSGTEGMRTVLLVPLGDRAPLATVAERLARTARQRALQPIVVDLSGQTVQSTMDPEADVGSMIDRLERENGAVIVQLPGLASEATVAALSENRPVLFVAPPGPVDRARLGSAVGTLRRLRVPCAGVIMNDSASRALT